MSRTGRDRGDRGDAEHGDRVGLRVQSAHDFDLLASERLGLVGLIQAVDLLLGLQHEFAAAFLDTEARTIRIGLQIRFHAQHFFVRLA